jgi:hypothetical protein
MTKKRTYDVSVEVIRAYVVKVEARTAGEAMQKVDALTPDYIDANGEYVDTHVVIADDPEVSDLGEES